MNVAHLHLVLTHLPIVLAPTGLVFLVVAMMRRSRELTNAAFVLLLVAGVAALGPFWTGEGAEHVVKGLPGVVDQLIERHEEAADLALAAMLVLAGLAGTALVLARFSQGLWAASRVLVLAAGLVAVCLILRTANLGGQIRHTEIRDGAAAVAATAGAAEEADDGD